MSAPKEGYLGKCVIHLASAKGRSTICFYDTDGKMIAGTIKNDAIDYDGKRVRVIVSVHKEDGGRILITIPWEKTKNAPDQQIWVEKDRVSFK